MKKIFAFIFCIGSINCWSQAFTKEYNREFANSNDAPAIGKNDHLKKIFRLKGLDIDKITEFVVIEEQYMDFSSNSSARLFGVVSAGNESFTYSYQSDLQKYQLTKNFLKQYNKVDANNARSIIYFLTKNKEIDKIEKLAKDEMNNDNSQTVHKWQYEVIAYNANAVNKIRLSYLHETLTKVFH